VKSIWLQTQPRHELAKALGYCRTLDRRFVARQCCYYSALFGMSPSSGEKRLRESTTTGATRSVASSTQITFIREQTIALAFSSTTFRKGSTSG
jgi:hypothetical protein